MVFWSFAFLTDQETPRPGNDKVADDDVNDDSTQDSQEVCRLHNFKLNKNFKHTFNHSLIKQKKDFCGKWNCKEEHNYYTGWFINCLGMSAIFCKVFNI